MGKHSLYSSSTIKMAMTQEQPLKSIAEQAETCSLGMLPSQNIWRLSVLESPLPLCLSFY